MNNRVSLVLLLLLNLATACSQKSDSTKNKNIPWSPLGLSLYSYRIIEGNDSTTSAFTQPIISYRYEVRGHTIFMSIKDSISYEKSWVKKDHLDDTDLLEHEQGHFDISQVYARKLATAFSNFYFTANFKEEIKQLEVKFFTEHNQMQNTYDEQTDHGINTDKQKEWFTMIKNSLNALAPINDKPIIQAIHFPQPNTLVKPKETL